MNNEIDKMDLNKHGFSIFQIETIGNCNMACTFCAYPIKEDTTLVMDEKLVYNLIDQVDPKAENFQYLTFNQYNEPLMDKRIFDFIKYANSKGIKSWLTTNGLLLNREETREKLIDAKPHFIKLSLQIVDPETFNVAKGVRMDIKKYYHAIYQTLSLAKDKDININIDVGCNFTPPLKTRIKNILGMSKGDPAVPDMPMDLENNLITFCQGFADFDPDFKFEKEHLRHFLQSIGRNYDWDQGFKLYPKISLNIKKFIFGLKLSEFEPIQSSFSCGTQIVGVVADGNVVPCCMIYDKDLSMGNANDASINEILDRKAKWIQNIRDYNCKKEDICKRCFGEPTKKGNFFRGIKNQLGHSYRQIKK